MSGAGAPVAADIVRLLGANEPSLLAVGPSAFTDASRPLRGLVTFLVVASLGGVLVWSDASFVDRSIDASLERPLSSLGYGIAAHAVIAFSAVYLSNKFARLAPFGGDGPLVGLLFGVVLLLGAGAVGFTVVGATIVELRGGRHRVLGLLLGALVAGGAVALATLTGAFVWFLLVSMGIGGAVRRWLHASVTSEH